MKICRLIHVALAIVTLSFSAARPCLAQSADWKPVPGHIMTRWATDVSPANAAPHAEYPRPQMVRDQWLSLNGLWDYAIMPANAKDLPSKWDGKILVPFPVESALSGVGQPLEPDQALWYRRTFTVPQDWANPRILLHLGAVDWQAEVRINGKSIGHHSGGYDPFSFDITSAINRPGGSSGGANELIVIARDPTDTGPQPRGKQVRNPESIWYTRSSGIWQSVWIEPVPNTHIDSCNIRPDLSGVEGTGGRVLVDVTGSEGEPQSGVEAEVLVNGQSIGRATAKPGATLAITIPNPHLWTPDDPYLYDLRLTLTDQNGQKDIVKCYFGMRDIRVGPDEHGVTRMLFNGKPLFQFGPLDQGFWPDGLYTAPTDAALKADVEAVKKMGCNMLRKHVKVEPARFYYWCDKLGVLVWQDMPSGNNPSDPPTARAEFEDELTRIIKARWNHPSIIMWVPFNEGWGQYDTSRIVDLVSKIDPTRLVNNASGWTDSGAGDVIDLHAYPGPGMLAPVGGRASVLGEFGGLGLPIENHTWAAKANWGYVTYKNPAELTDAYVALIDKLHPFIAQGLSAAVYTQLSDVEIECNGWLTYDRAQFKIDPDRAAAATRKLYEAHGWVRTILPTAAQATTEVPAATWRYTTQKPPDGWEKPDFNDSSWQQGPAGFGTKGTPGTGGAIGTQWNTSDIWIRRTFDLATNDVNDPRLAIHHDEDAEVYLNGQRIAALKGYTSGYVLEALTPQAKTLLKQGRNTLAIHCHQTKGGQFIDAGLADMMPAK